MKDPEVSLTSRLNRAFVHGERADTALVIEEIYPEILDIASRMKGRVRFDGAQTLELLSEALVRLDGIKREWVDRQHFFATFARAVRCARVDAARQNRRTSRLEDEDRIAGPSGSPSYRTLDLEKALLQLELERPAAAQILTMHIFLGLQLKVIAKDLDLPEITVRRLFQLSKNRLAELLRSYAERP